VCLKIFINSIKEHQRKKTILLDNIKKEARRKIRIFVPDNSVSDEKLDDAIENNPQLVKKLMFSEHPNQDIINTYNDVQTRAKEVEKKISNKYKRNL